ncbi:hypothetical protein GCM10022200_18430 [Microbacterium awajiense]|uniref:AAA+ ATPase domain-containing protein n=2 Tax=Microbacterium awajiense TaxID=415214 RepID=A0ABP7ALL3_9MICO
MAVQFDDSVTPSDRVALLAPWDHLRTDEAATRVIRVRSVSGGTGRRPSESDHLASRDVSAPSLVGLGSQLTTGITLDAIDALRGQALLLHACAVALDDGRVIGFVGPSGRGKTTASRVLGERFAYVTDETLAVRSDLSVIPYPKPLSIVSGPDGKHQRSPRSLGLRTDLPDDLRLAALVLLDRQQGKAEPTVHRVALNPGIAELAEQSSYLAELPTPLVSLADVLAHTGGLRRVCYGEATSLLSVVDEILKLDDPAPPRLLPARAAVAPSSKATARRYHRTEYVDAARLDHELFVLRTGQITVLDGVGPAIWAAAGGATRDELVHAAVRELDEPPPGVDAPTVVDAATQALIERGLLKVS